MTINELYDIEKKINMHTYTKCQQCLNQPEWGSPSKYAKIVRDRTM